MFFTVFDYQIRLENLKVYTNVLVWRLSTQYFATILLRSKIFVLQCTIDVTKIFGLEAVPFLRILKITPFYVQTATLKWVNDLTDILHLEKCGRCL